MKPPINGKPLPWTVGLSGVQNDGSVAIIDANDERVGRIDGGKDWTSDLGMKHAQEFVDWINKGVH